MPRPSPPLRLPTSGGSLASLGDANSCVLSPSLAAFSLPRASALSLFAPGFMAQDHNYELMGGGGFIRTEDTHTLGTPKG